MSAETPVLVDLKPTGSYYMEDFHRAGGVPAVLRELGDLIHRAVPTVTGRTLGEEIDDVGPGFPQDIVRPRSNPIYPEGSLAFLRGNLAPGGAIIKQAAVSPHLLEHTGRAVVFEDTADLAARIDDDALDVAAEDVLVLRNIGPVGAPGMPEAGYLPIPKKLAAQGVKDMVRISDGRMSAAAAGAIRRHHHLECEPPSDPARRSRRGVGAARGGIGPAARTRGGARLPEAVRLGGDAG